MEKLDKSVYWMLDEKERRRDDRRDILIISILVTILAGCILTLVVLVRFTRPAVRSVATASECRIPGAGCQASFTADNSGMPGEG